jgi:hypothetical protein
LHEKHVRSRDLHPPDEQTKSSHNYQVGKQSLAEETFVCSIQKGLHCLLVVVLFHRIHKLSLFARLIIARDSIQGAFWKCNIALSSTMLAIVDIVWDRLAHSTRICTYSDEMAISYILSPVIMSKKA